MKHLIIVFMLISVNIHADELSKSVKKDLASPYPKYITINAETGVSIENLDLSGSTIEINAGTGVFLEGNVLTGSVINDYSEGRVLIDGE